MDFNFGAFDMIVTSKEVGARLHELLGVAIQRIPVEIDEAEGEYEIVNVLNIVDCIDDMRTKSLKWSVGDGRPEKVGQYRMIARLQIDQLKAAGHDFFRLAKWPVALIASERVRGLFEELNVRGARFENVG